jgi:hypothetical protein
MKIGKVTLVLIVVIVLLGAYVLGYLSFLFPQKADVGFMFDNAPSNISGGTITIDGVYNPVLTSAQGGFVQMKLGSTHTFQLDIGGKSFSGTFIVPNSVPKGDCVIVHINWNTSVITVLTQAE